MKSREAGIFRSFKINGVPALSILAIPALTTAFHALIVSLIIAVTAGPLFKGVRPNPGAFSSCYSVDAFAYSGLGMLIGVISKRLALHGAVVAAHLPALHVAERVDDAAIVHP